MTSTVMQISSNIRGTGVYLPMAFYTNGTERLRILTNGNIGIGTTTPSAGLDIVGSSKINGDFTYGGTNKKVIAINAASYTLPVLGTKLAILNLATNSVCKVLLSSSENTFYQPIELYLSRSGLAGAPIIVRDSMQVHQHSNAIGFSSDTNGDVWAEKISYDTGRALSLVRLEELQGSCSILSGATTGAGVNTDQSLISSNLFLKNGNSIYYNNGNVGFGTTGPVNSLTLSKAGGADLGLIDSTSGKTYHMNVRSDGLNFAETGVADGRFFLKNGGNVGIGTTTPSYPLHVSKNTSADSSSIVTDGYSGTSVVLNSILLRGARGTSASPSAALLGDLIEVMGARPYGTNQFALSSTANVTAVATENMTNTAMGTALRFGTTPNGSATSAERMRIDSNGNVGIGTANPTSKLVIKGSTSDNTANALNVTDSSDVSKFYVRNDGVIVMPGIVYGGGMANASTANNSNLVLASTGSTISRNIADANPSLIVQQTNAGSSGDILQLKNNATTVMTIQQGGDVGIGTTSPSYKLDVQGGDINASGSVRAAGIALTSDIRYKKDILPLENVLEKILKIRGVSYNWKTDEFPEKQFSDRHQIGVIAQEVERQFPEVVDTNKDGFKSVNYPALVAPLIEAVKSLYRKILDIGHSLVDHSRRIASIELNKADKEEIKILKTENAKIKAENEEIKSRLEKIEKMLVKNK